MYCVALRLNPCNVTQQATWRPPCGVRRDTKTLTLLYKKNQMCLEIFYMGSQCHHLPNPNLNLNIHLLWVFFSFLVFLSQILSRIRFIAIRRRHVTMRWTCNMRVYCHCFVGEKCMGISAPSILLIRSSCSGRIC